MSTDGDRALIQRDSTSSSMILSSSSLAMAPPPSRPPRKTLASQLPKTVLDEDTYISGLAHVIQRDYFPDLGKMRASAEYLDAVESGDSARVRDATLELARTTGRLGGRFPGTPSSIAGTPRATPSFGGRAVTPSLGSSLDETDRASSPSADPPTPPVDVSLPLSSYQAVYTSEDNASFAVQVDKENERKREKYAWAYNAEHKGAIEDAKRPGNTYNGRPLITDGIGGTVLLIEDGRGTPAGGRSGGDRTEESSKESTTTTITAPPPSPNPFKPPSRHAGPAGWRNHAALNNLFYHLDGVAPSPNDPIPTGPPPEIVRTNTRMPKLPSASGTADGTGSATPRLTLAPSDTQVRMETQRVFHAMAAATPGLFGPSATGRGGGGATPSFGFVPASPSVAPLDVPPDTLMTWGDIEATPMLLEAVGDMGSVDDVGGPRFSMAPTPRREELAANLGRKAGGAAAAAKARADALPGLTPRSVRPSSPAVGDRVRALSPAARTLLQRAGGKAGSAATALSGRARGSVSKAQSGRHMAGGWTPELTGSGMQKRRKVGEFEGVALASVKVEPGSGGSVTDGLLEIGGR
ncbi:hypothetical protein M427DRAFT_71550 [Gonapodya prolifera JEL478]|uniref:Protein DGCR14 n=1 Tax=Gonapodya prolifera (strain JEL478) TaxID=1344416 RepID=A0A139A8L4_GONPJ|nr:hypothetical protein M427DRAFT_71550 [Gonapodya prolifera JEL478]|eukprot:KXS13141.1 hypothetical protein M427DRAFT_71550 [Gonapodya prolifera JEL478]